MYHVPLDHRSTTGSRPGDGMNTMGLCRRSMFIVQRVSVHAAVLLLSASLGACDGKENDVDEGPAPAPMIELDDATYQDMVAAFYTGVTAIHVGGNDTARAAFVRATELVPGEAAGWANLALTELRLGKAEPAGVALAEAKRLAPDNSRIAHLSAISALRGGDREAADVELRRAIELDGTNVRARYALFEELRRTSDAGNDAEARDALERILEVLPDNVVVLGDLALLDASIESLETVETTLARFASTSSTWPVDAREQLDRALTAAKTGDGRATTIAILGVNNLLLGTAIHERSFSAIKSPPKALGEPLEAFTALPAPSPRPAPADTELAFAPLSGQPEGVLWARGFTLDQDSPPLLVVAFEEGLSVSGGNFAYVSPGDSAGDGAESTDGSDGNEGASDEADAEDSEEVLADSEDSGSGDSGSGDAFELHPALRAEVTSRGVLAFDADNDGQSELAVAGPGGMSLMAQGEPGEWLDATPDSGLDADVIDGAYTGVWAFDTELDGDLDLLLGTPESAPVLLRNLGDGTWSAESPLPDVTGTQAVAWADVDSDGDPDLALIDDTDRLFLFTNERSDRYISIPLGTAAESARALAVADVNVDGVLDLTVLRADGVIERVGLDETGAELAWSAEEIASLAASPGPGIAELIWADLDNNGAADLIASVDGATSIWLAGEDGALSLFPVEAADTLGTASVIDVGNDGLLDILGVKDGRPQTLTNLGGSKEYGWLAIQPKAIRTGGQKNNTFGLGGEMDFRAGLLYQKRPMDGPVVHFGLGEHDAANVVRIRWPNGAAQGEFDMANATAIVVKQRLEGSCPWLFAWDGSEMGFVTDVLWRSPLGLRINAQVTAGVVMTRDWVKLSGDQLKARDGRLETAITAELWETHYFDEFGLIAIDHPAGTEIWVDERFSIPPPPLEVQVTGPVMPIVQAVDDAGRDVTALVLERDGRYLDTFALGDYQGITSEHSVEVLVDSIGAMSSIGSVDATAGESTDEAAPLYLIAQGWVRPTDSSINVALSQGSGAQPQGLRLDVTDNAVDGGWRELHANLGFPAGKRKTMLIDLNGAWPEGFTGERRVRLSTNLEVYWDRLGVAAGRSDAIIARADLPADTAELRPRGFSYTSHFTPQGVDPAPVTVPEIPDYESIASTSPQWLDLVGLYTRYGDVSELVASADDRYVIANAGDEVRLDFVEPPAPADGMIRDYVFVSEGWIKDGDFNTAYSKTVHPLPSHDRPEYVDQVVYGEAGRLIDDPVYKRFADDWQKYHTRFVSPRGFLRALVVGDGTGGLGQSHAP